MSPPVAAVAVVLIAVGLRVAALHDFEATLAANHPMVDAFTYWQQAGELFEGRDPFADGYYQPPAYPWLLSKLMGLWGELSLEMVRRFHALLGVLTVVGVLVLGHRLGEHLQRPWLGPVAGLLFALSPTPMLFEHDVLTPALTLAASTWAGVVTVEASRKKSVALFLLAGVFAGVACAAHPTYLLAGFTAVVAVGQAGHSAGRWLPAAALAVGMAAPLAPTTVHNAQQFGVFELVSHNGGLNFYLGNNPAMRETAFLRPGLPFRQLVLEANPAERSLPERNRWWWSQTVTEAAASPWSVAAVIGVKAIWSVNDVELPRNEDYRCRTGAGQPLAWMGWLPGRFGVLFPLAVAGAIGVLRRRQASVWLLALWVALHAPLVLFLVSDRYRVASWPLVVLLAAAGLIHLLRHRERSTVVGAVLAGLVAFLPLDQQTAMDPSWCRYQAANLAYMDGDLAGAKEGYTAVVASPGWEDDMGAHYWLGRLAERDKDWPVAIAHLDVVLKQFPDHYPTLVARADASYYAGRKEECAAHLLRAYRVPGDRTSTGVKLVKLLRRMGRTEEARALLAEDPKLASHPKLR